MLRFVTSLKSALFILLIMSIILPQNAHSQKFDKLKQAKLKQAKMGKGKYGASGGGKIVFSNQPINPDNPANLSSSFSAGERIYALIQVEEPWIELERVANQEKTEAKIPLAVVIDGNRLFQYITVKNQNIIRGKYLVLDVAPEIIKMTTYSDPHILFPDAYGSKWGPATFTDKFAQLSGGSHTVNFEIMSYGSVYSSGEFTISGNDYSAYAALHEKIKGVITANRAMPAAKMTNKNLESEMLQLCENAGMSNIQKLVIVDKDWWIDRVAGGDSSVKSRHMAAAVGFKDGSGCYYKTVTFYQHLLITGGFGPLELTHTSDKVVLPDNSF